ncbi:NigD1/NigD2 family lipoprotein [Alkalitalea saponilacus]|uniref:NigD-like protein n=1 Tax=Alkalitalea saponilacus TaxID=889453 RepID=A0A1T5D8Y2_9BACT|nr:NigD-like C-terminal domain-containing protein [Alkalitalea saponilacus]ASB50619.1 hypothetical protein CDL62_16435 [Alkalitalea saponilacus]SKB67950.1 NigD-like protein [Alkalitalea saponilacus]
MKILKSLLIGVLLVAITGLTSCKVEDDYEQLYLAMGNVIGNSPSTFLIEADDGTILRPIEYPSDYDEIIEGKRVFFYFKHVDAGRDDQNFDYSIRIQAMQDVLTKGILNVDSEGRDTLKRDPVRIINAWIGKSYLNVEFSFFGHEKAHIFDLLLDPGEQYKGGFTTLDFHHDARNDKQYYNLRGIISFDLTELQKESVDSINIFFRADDDSFTSRELIYRYSDE